VDCLARKEPGEGLALLRSLAAFRGLDLAQVWGLGWIQVLVRDLAQV